MWACVYTCENLEMLKGTCNISLTCSFGKRVHMFPHRYAIVGTSSFSDNRTSEQGQQAPAVCQ